MAHTYYLTQDDSGNVELRQTRYRERYHFGDPHPHDVCAVARSKPEMRQMLTGLHLNGTIDWDSIYDWRDVDWLSVPTLHGPFRSGFRRVPNMLEPLSVMMVKAGISLVRMSRGYHELTERQFDHARRVNGPELSIDDTYATALMGGEPYSDWN